MAKKKRVLVFGAHPDDCDVKCGGIAIKYGDAGHIVKFVSTTNGATGHHEIGGIELARRRYAEAQASKEIAKLADYQVLDWHTGELIPSVFFRKEIIKIIREFLPDIIITHRPNDYHPDHRYTSQLVQDASYIITVPNMVPLTDIMPKMPVIFYMWDTFKKPNPFCADIVVDIDNAMDRKLDMLHCHKSQMYEWIPFNQNVLKEVPESDADRRRWLEESVFPRRNWGLEGAYRDRVIELYGEEKANSIRYIEAFELCEYGQQIGLDKKSISEIFPFYD